MKSIIRLKELIEASGSGVRRFLKFILIATSLAWLLSLGVAVTDTNATSCSDVTQVPTIECEALVALYNSTNGPGWVNNTNWLNFEAQAPCNWYGVHCEKGHVVELQLCGNGLSGSLPSELGNLVEAEFLYICGNPELGGSIPPELGNLVKLGTLFLESNQLSGSIPPELGNIIGLRWVLSLSGNRLSGSIPPELGKLTNVGDIYLSGNQLSGSIPPELGNMTNAGHLYLSSNQLSGSVPPELGNLTHLVELHLNHNPLSGSLPLNLIHLNLYYFSFDHTNLCESPDPAFQYWISHIRGVMGTEDGVSSTGVICNFTQGFIDFETPSLGTAPRQTINPYKEATTEVMFTVEPTGSGDIGLVKNSAISTCLEPAEDNQKLGTGQSSGSSEEEIGLSGFPIKATFPILLTPLVTVSVKFEAPVGSPVRLRLFDASGAEVASMTDLAFPACGLPGQPTARKVVSATSTQPVAFAIMDIETPDNPNFVIDNFSFLSNIRLIYLPLIIKRPIQF